MGDRTHNCLSPRAANTHLLHENHDLYQRSSAGDNISESATYVNAFFDGKAGDLGGYTDDYLCYRIHFNPFKRAFEFGL